jgi:hypothetical protein
MEIAFLYGHLEEVRDYLTSSVREKSAPGLDASRWLAQQGLLATRPVRTLLVR